MDESLDLKLGRRYWLAFSKRCFKPCCFSDMKLFECLFRGFTEGRTKFEIGDIGDVAFVFFAVKDVNVVVFHAYNSYILPTEAVLEISGLIKGFLASSSSLQRLLSLS